jgi:hypothetical protein
MTRETREIGGMNRSTGALRRRSRLFVSTTAAAAIGCLAILAGSGNAIASGCPNEPLRLGPSALLPGCRAYEMVSPVDKNKGGISTNSNAFVSPNGEGVLFTSISGFAETPSVVLNTNYVSRRGQAAWNTESVTPPLFNPGTTLVNVTSPASSPDLTKTLQFSTLALTPGAIEGGSNVYIRDNLTGTRRLVVALPGEAFFNSISSGETFYFSGNSDWSGMLFETKYPLTAEAASSEEVHHLYEYHDGRLELVDRQPKDQSTGESPVFPKGVLTAQVLVANTHVVSEDGSRVFFSAAQEQPDAGALLMREVQGGVARTVPISTDHRPGPTNGNVGTGSFAGASADGSVVYFLSTEDLTPGAETHGSSALYRYEVDGDALTDMTPSSSSAGPQVAQVLGVGDDGSDVYFTSPAVLAEGAVQESERGNYYALVGEKIKLIATTTAATSASAGEALVPRQSLASPNGRYFAFASLSSLTSDALPGNEASCPTLFLFPGEPGECYEVYRFDADPGTLECVSCSGAAPTGTSLIGGLRYRRYEIAGDRATESVLDNGTVYIESSNSLLPGDVNETTDVYAVGGGRKELISTGTSPQPSNFGDATPTGSNVFFYTAQSLVKSDVDSSIDVYDDREGGGLESQWPPGEIGPCEGEGCRGDAPPPPTSLASSSGEGCDALIVRSQAAGARAKALNRNARKAARGKGPSAKKRSLRVRRQARKQQVKAKQIEKQAKLCRRQGR